MNRNITLALTVEEAQALLETVLASPAQSGLVTARLRRLLKEETESDPARDEAYIAEARLLHHRDGEVEIDGSAVVSYGNDPGAYVQAWVWVDESDLAPEAQDAEEQEQ